MAAKLFVGNLSFQATEEDLRELFAQAGTVETVRIITDQFTGRPRGFGFVEMATKEEATKAVEMLNGRLFRDRNLVVDEARPQPQLGAGGASSTTRLRSRKSRPLSISTAFVASSFVAISTKPNPRGRPVNWSVMIRTVSTVPACANSSRRSSSVAWKERLPTNNFAAISRTSCPR